jgi:hypothetical protein
VLRKWVDCCERFGGESVAVCAARWRSISPSRAVSQACPASHDRERYVISKFHAYGVALQGIVTRVVTGYSVP